MLFELKLTIKIERKKKTAPKRKPRKPSSTTTNIITNIS